MEQIIPTTPRVLAIIPARSGSKGLKDKNIKLLLGKPLLAYTIEAAINSGVFSTVHVSTDSKEYSAIAKQFGADQPFLRNNATSGDASSSWDVVREVLLKYKETGMEFDYLSLLQPTSPLRSAEDIKKAFALFTEKDARTLVSVTETNHPIQWCFPLDSTLSMEEFCKSPYKDCRRQELDKHYLENGAIYIAHAKDAIKQDFDFYLDKCFAYIMSRNKSIDIDTMIDFQISELLMKSDSYE